MQLVILYINVITSHTDPMRIGIDFALSTTKKLCREVHNPTLPGKSLGTRLPSTLIKITFDGHMFSPGSGILILMLSLTRGHRGQFPVLVFRGLIFHWRIEKC